MADSPISHHSGGGDKQSQDDAASSEERAQMEQAYQQMQRKLRITKLDEEIKHKIMVLSGKGGVGKSTVATGLALSLARRGMKVGLMDIDITGPNVPKMLGLDDAELNVEDGQIFPAIGPHGLRVISMAFLIEDPDKPVIWRGPIKLGAIQQFIGDVAWGELDALIVDFPPDSQSELARYRRRCYCHYASGGSLARQSQVDQLRQDPLSPRPRRGREHERLHHPRDR